MRRRRLRDAEGDLVVRPAFAPSLLLSGALRRRTNGRRVCGDLRDDPFDRGDRLRLPAAGGHLARRARVRRARSPDLLRGRRRHQHCARAAAPGAPARTRGDVARDGREAIDRRHLVDGRSRSAHAAQRDHPGVVRARSSQSPRAGHREDAAPHPALHRPRTRSGRGRPQRDARRRGRATRHRRAVRRARALRPLDRRGRAPRQPKRGASRV